MEPNRVRGGDRGSDRQIDVSPRLSRAVGPSAAPTSRSPPRPCSRRARVEPERVPARGRAPSWGYHTPSTDHSHPPTGVRPEEVGDPAAEPPKGNNYVWACGLRNLQGPTAPGQRAPAEFRGRIAGDMAKARTGRSSSVQPFFYGKRRAAQGERAAPSKSTPGSAPTSGSAPTRPGPRARA